MPKRRHDQATLAKSRWSARSRGVRPGRPSFVWGTRAVQPTVIDWDDASLEEFPGNGVRKRRIPGAGAELVRVEVPAGTRAGRHSHPFEQFVQVISGNGVLETEDGTREFRQGSVFHLPAHAWHAAEFHTDTVLIETNLDSPGR